MLFRSLLVAAALAVAPVALHADILTFDLNGVWATAPIVPYVIGPSEGSLTGTITIDTTLGVGVSSDFTATVNGVTYTFQSPADNTIYYASSNITSINFGDTTNDADIDILFNGDPLVGYTGGDLCSTDEPCGTYQATDLHAGSYYFADVASLSPAITPEPSSLILLGTGIASVAATLRRRLA